MEKFDTPAVRSGQSRTFESVGMWDNSFASVTGLDEPEQVEVMFVTHETLPMLGASVLASPLAMGTLRRTGNRSTKAYRF